MSLSIAYIVVSMTTNYGK